MGVRRQAAHELSMGFGSRSWDNRESCAEIGDGAVEAVGGAILGSQPRRVRASVMTGRRCLGSSDGSGENDV